MEKVAGSGNVVRVALTGSESTGKSVLARQLAELYNAELSTEFVREFVERKGTPVEFADTDAIARGQIALEDEHAKRAQKLLLHDTDLLSTMVYSTHYYGQCADWIQQKAQERRPDLYLLLEIDVPWIPDDVRDRENRRDEMQASFRRAVMESGTPYVVIQGDWERRLQLARQAIDALLEP